MPATDINAPGLIMKIAQLAENYHAGLCEVRRCMETALQDKDLSPRARSALARAQHEVTWMLRLLDGGGR